MANNNKVADSKLKQKLDIRIEIFKRYRISNGEVYAGSLSLDEAVDAIMSKKEEKKEVIEKVTKNEKINKNKVGFFRRFFFSEYEGEDY